MDQPSNGKEAIKWLIVAAGLAPVALAALILLLDALGWLAHETAVRLLDVLRQSVLSWFSPPPTASLGLPG